MDTTLDSYDPAAATGTSFGGTKTSQLWKTHDAKANKTGPHHTVFWVKGNKEGAASKRLGVGAKGPPTYTTGSKYAGSWQDNRKEGYGTLTKASGEKYEGEFVADKRHGRGTLWVRRKGGQLRKVYVGDWYENKRSGVGVYFFKDGGRYEGDWLDNKRQGRGRMEYPNGDVYDGEWNADRREGVGAFVLGNGDSFEGHWKDDKKEGPGRYFYMSTMKMYEGEWVDDVAKCGVFSDVPPELLDASVAPHAAEDKFKLPELGLAEPDAVVIGAVEDACRWRATRGTDAAGAGAGPRPSNDLSAEEMSQLLAAFEVADVEGSGVIAGSQLPAVLAQLGISPSPEALEGLLEELGATRESDVSFADFADCMARLRE